MVPDEYKLVCSFMNSEKTPILNTFIFGVACLFLLSVTGVIFQKFNMIGPVGPPLWHTSSSNLKTVNTTLYKARAYILPVLPEWTIEIIFLYKC